MTKTATVCSATVIGLEGILVDVEADVAAGLPAFSLVGLPDASVKESRDRVRAAIKNCDVAFPRTHVTVNLAPADLRKEGPAFDLPIACAIMLADGKVRFEREDGSQGEARAVRGFDHDTLLIGELGLDGSIRPTIGILPVILAARQRNIQTVILPLGNVDEAAVIDGITLLPVVHLREVIGHLLGAERITPHTRNTNAWTRDATPSTYDFTYIHGLRHAKRALEIAAAGGHNLLFVGPPGTGKSLLAKALPTILPSMTKEEQLEVTLAHSVVGLAPSGGLIRERPFRSPHHSASDIAIIGGGTIPRPGEVTLAHRGVLFMDEFPEFKRSVLEVLRQPLEDGVVTISRAAGTLTFPARFQLIAAQNPCPCGYWRDEERACICAPGQILRYQQRVSGPLLDRIDIVVDVPRQSTEILLTEPHEEPSATSRARVEAARDRQRARAAATGTVPLNTELSAPALRIVAPLDDESRQTLIRAADRFHLSSRATIRTLRVARTIADLDGHEQVTANHLREALQYRPKEEILT